MIVPGAAGLRLVATQQYRTWIYRYRSPVDGATRQVRLGRWPAMGLPAALAAWERTKQARDAGADPAAEKRAKRVEAAARAGADAYTVRRACDLWLAQHQRRVTAKTYREAERLLARELEAQALPGLSKAR